MKKTIQALLLMGLVFIIAACSNSDNTNQANEDEGMNYVAPFEAVTQDGDDFSNEDLDGKWWIADFIFTNCETVCLPMTSNMKKIQTALTAEGIDNFELVSYSIDPERDTPQVLTDYAKEYDADLNTWTFLTGYEFDYIKDLAVDSFKNLVAAPTDGTDQVMHGTFFFIVNPEGKIAGHYSGIESVQVDQLIEDFIEYAK